MRNIIGMKLLKGDAAIVILVLLSGIILLLVLANTVSAGATVEVYIDTVLYGEYPLYMNDTIELDTMTVQISQGSVFVEKSDCNNKICEHTGKIKKKGQTIICLPNKIFIRIE